jgi:hypothetical protein
MGMTQDIPSIMKLTGVKCRTIEQIFQDYRNKGTVMREHVYQELRGRKHSLTPANTKVKSISQWSHQLCDRFCHSFCVDHRPDWFLDELLNLLKHNRFISVHYTTIHREIERAAVSTKKLDEIAEERSEPSRLDYIREISQIPVDYLAFP